MKKIVQLFDAKGKPDGGRVFIAPDEESLALSMADLQKGYKEVESEDLIVSADPAPAEII